MAAQTALEIAVTFFLLVGSAFVLVGAIGLVRFPDFFTRLHAPTKAATLGVGSMLIASMLDALGRGEAGFPELLITLFLFVTAPVSAHVLAKAGIASGLPSVAPPPDMERAAPPRSPDAG